MNGMNVTSPDKVEVVHGSIFWPKGTHAKVSKIIVHEEYDDEFVFNDVALLKLATPLKFDQFTQLVKLRKDPVPIGASVVISGFGDVVTGGPPSEKLKYTKMTVTSQKECANSFKYTHEGFICFNSPKKTGICNGDSGGPAVYNNELIGVVSFGKVKCATVAPDRFQKVSHYFDWIHEHMK
jgi:secreted trypsin-like serine protease